MNRARLPEASSRPFAARSQANLPRISCTRLNKVLGHLVRRGALVLAVSAGLGLVAGAQRTEAAPINPGFAALPTHDPIDITKVQWRGRPGWGGPGWRGPGWRGPGWHGGWAGGPQYYWRPGYGWVPFAAFGAAVAATAATAGAYYAPPPPYYGPCGGPCDPPPPPPPLK